MAVRTQTALYAEIDLELSWSEQQLPQRERTRHVHGLHPYLGKFPPQLAEALLRRHFAPAAVVLDPFCGSGTTLVEAVAMGIGAVGIDVSAFNVLLTREKLRAHEPAVATALGGLVDSAATQAADPAYAPEVPGHLLRWHGEKARRELCAYRDAIDPDAPWSGLAALVLSRSARSSRLVRHDSLDHAAEPVGAPYWCYKHRRVCTPTEGAAQFLRRYTTDVLRRVEAFAAVRGAAPWQVLHADARSALLPPGLDGIVTSPPYVGVLDYHAQHAYAFDLLGLESRAPDEIGPAARGTGRTAVAAYCADMSEALAHVAGALAPGAPIVIVVNDRLRLYDGILREAGLVLESRSLRHVNRRTSRRAGEYFEEILVARRA